MSSAGTERQVTHTGRLHDRSSPVTGRPVTRGGCRPAWRCSSPLSALGALLIAAILRRRPARLPTSSARPSGATARRAQLYRYAGHGDPADLADAREALRAAGERRSPGPWSATRSTLAAARAGSCGGNAPQGYRNTWSDVPLAARCAVPANRSAYGGRAEAEIDQLVAGRYAGSPSPGAARAR